MKKPLKSLAALFKGIDMHASVKNTVVILVILVLLSFIGPVENERGVYICKGKGSKKYHYIKSCRGLSNCSTKTYEVSISSARQLGRTLCGWED